MLLDHWKSGPSYNWISCFSLEDEAACSVEQRPTITVFNMLQQVGGMEGWTKRWLNFCKCGFFFHRAYGWCYILPCDLSILRLCSILGQNSMQCLLLTSLLGLLPAGLSSPQDRRTTKHSANPRTLLIDGLEFSMGKCLSCIYWTFICPQLYATHCRQTQDKRDKFSQKGYSSFRLSRFCSCHLTIR